VNEAETMGHQVLGLLNRKVDAILLHLLIVSLNWLQGCKDFIWNHSLREFKHSLESVVAENGHDAWNNQAVDASSATVSHPLVEDVVLEKQLRYYEVSASINFLPQEFNVVCTTRGLQVCLGITSNSNTEKVSILLFYEAHQVNCIVEPIFVVDPVSGATRGVTT
jgi:hypothetical protein